MSDTQTVPPPTYTEPGENGERGPEPIPDDFKISDVAAECTIDIRHRFLQRVYFLLAIQLAITVAFSAVIITHPGIQQWALANTWLLYTSMAGSFATMIGSMILRRKFPWNIILLTSFTVCESWLVGIVTSMYDTHIVVNAFMMTFIIFTGLSLFAIQTKYDFTGWMPYLTSFLFALVGLGMVSMFMQSSATDLAFSFISVILFSVFILVDTQTVMNKFHPEDVVPAVIEFYLDIINLFLNILRILNQSN